LRELFVYLSAFLESLQFPYMNTMAERN
jgi:hypothetical protein